MKLTMPVLLVVPEPLSYRTTVQDYLQREAGWSGSFDHPDLHWINEDESPLTIAQVRQLLTDVSYQAFGTQGQYFIIHNLSQASVPAQNALLKLLEESPPSLQIILTVRQLNGVVSTITSRCVIQHRLPAPSSSTTPSEASLNDLPKEIRDFIDQPDKKNWAEIITLTESHSDRATAQNLIQRLIEYLHQDLITRPTAGRQRQLQQLGQTQQHLQKNANVRLALEDCFFQLKRIAQQT